MQNASFRRQTPPFLRDGDLSGGRQPPAPADPDLSRGITQMATLFRRSNTA